jgi:hypothetical protein
MWVVGWHYVNDDMYIALSGCRPFSSCPRMGWRERASSVRSGESKHCKKLGHGFLFIESVQNLSNLDNIKAVQRE